MFSIKLYGMHVAGSNPAFLKTLGWRSLKRSWQECFRYTGNCAVSPPDAALLLAPFATVLRGCVSPGLVVSERLGHSSVKITLDTYSHVLPTMQREATEKLGNLLYQNDEEEHLYN